MDEKNNQPGPGCTCSCHKVPDIASDSKGSSPTLRVRLTALDGSHRVVEIQEGTLWPQYVSFDGRVFGLQSERAGGTPVYLEVRLELAMALKPPPRCPWCCELLVGTLSEHEAECVSERGSWIVLEKTKPAPEDEGVTQWCRCGVVLQEDEYESVWCEVCVKAGVPGAGIETKHD